MNHPLKTLANHVHILIVSILMVALSLGMMGNSLSVENPTAGAKKVPQVIQPLTSPVAGDSHEGSISAGFTPVEASGAPQMAQNEPNQSTSTSLPGSPAGSTPVAADPGAICTPCTAASGCSSACPAPPPAPEPPISGGCGVCGDGRYQPHTMCPMYCLAPIR
jgi:hypothetical protein